jgi:acetylornithine deacetylase
MTSEVSTSTGAAFAHVTERNDSATSVTPSPDALSWVSKLIGFDTTSRCSNLGLVEAVRDELARRGFRLALTCDATGGKANLLASRPADDGRLEGGLVLSGHVDTVPIDGQAWTSDPFRAVVKDGRLYGRGACDMKGFVGTALAVAVTAAARPLSAPIHLALSYDEELGCLGVPHLVADMQRRDIAPAGCIVGEPSMMQVITGHKGANAYRAHVTGLARHSSQAPKGVNAIEYAARLIAHMATMAERFADAGPFDSHFGIPHSTMQTGTIGGGIAINTVPADCEFAFEFRNLPAVPAGSIIAEIERYAQEVLVPAMRARSATADIRLEALSIMPALAADEAAPFTRLVRELVGDQAIRKVAYGTEAGYFQAAGIPTVVCGPGDIAQAHIDDEFVSLEQLARCERFLHQLIGRMCRLDTSAAS